MIRRSAVALGAAAVLFVGPDGERRDWPVAGGDPGNRRYSPLTQINRGNVRGLHVAWVYHTRDRPDNNHSEIQATPVVVNGVLYATSPGLAVFALTAGIGEELWRFDPFAGRTPEPHANRGVVYWADGADQRILFTAGQRLYALDARTGRPVAGFGTSGWVDFGAGLGRDATGQFLVATSPGVIYKDLLIQGQRVGEGEGSLPGFVRAYDVRAGRIRWTFHTIPQPGAFG